MAFPPLVSSTPPPLDNFGDSEEDEFGDFTTGGIDGLSVSSDSPHKLATPMRTPLPSQNASPKVNGIAEAAESVSQPDVASMPTIAEDVLILEKTGETVSDIKLRKAESGDGASKRSSENVDSNDAEDGTERGGFGGAGLASESSSLGESEQEASPNHLEDIEPLSLDLGDPTVAPDTTQHLDSDFYDYEQFEDSENWVSNGDAPAEVPKTEYFEFREAEDISENFSNFSKDFSADTKKDVHLVLENSDEKPRLEDRRIEDISVPDESEANDQKCVEFPGFHGSIEGDALSANKSRGEFAASNREEDEFADDFCGFTENANVEKNFLSAPLPDVSSCSSEEFGDFKCDSILETSAATVQGEFRDASERKGGTTVEDDDFGDFTNFTDQTQFEKISEPKVPDEDEDDDFEDFNDFESALEQPAVENTQFNLKESISRIENKNATNKIEDIITTMFPMDSKECEVQVQSLISQTDKIWQSIKSVEETNALTYQWANSTSNNVMLKSLGIDSRNILFGPRWNPNVPRFAANLGFTPLEPIKAIADAQPPSATNPSKTQGFINSEEVPAAQFDWNSSGLVNPLEASGGLSALLPLDFLCPFDPLLTSHSSANSESYRRPSSARNSVNHHAPEVNVNRQRCNSVSKAETGDLSESEAPRSQKRSQPAKMIEPLPAPRAAEWKRKADPDAGHRSRNTGPHRGAPPEKQFPPSEKHHVVNERQFAPPEKQYLPSEKSSLGDIYRGRSVNKRSGPEHVVMDRFGRVMPIQPETAKVLNRLPDLSFLSARTLLLDREHKQIACELGVMNRKMPG
ncbi:aftiphilin isoform X2 [Andrena cerasifolii]|uniref:aftiphilin isoform X2 n=1 Tax=Andrena cerasifolii TaxID=2819439 RepID=UPI0040380392